MTFGLDNDRIQRPGQRIDHRRATKAANLHTTLSRRKVTRHIAAQAAENDCIASPAKGVRKDIFKTHFTVALRAQNAIGKDRHTSSEI
jgi:uncharacterized protein YijF (DUF1287 family)